MVSVQSDVKMCANTSSCQQVCCFVVVKMCVMVLRSEVNIQSPKFI